MPSTFPAERSQFGGLTVVSSFGPQPTNVSARSGSVWGSNGLTGMVRGVRTQGLAAALSSVEVLEPHDMCVGAQPLLWGMPGCY